VTSDGTAGRPRIFGILNVTPDSFSDGGNFFSPDAALDRAREMVSDGADVIDVGGESTRPGAGAVTAAEEMRRVLPVVTAIAASVDIPISIDTVKSEVAREALAAGATIINDVSGMRLDPAMPAVAADADCEVVLMHSRGSVAEMARYDLAIYGDDSVGEIIFELLDRAVAVEKAGIARSRIILDPGIGFSKRSAHSLSVLREVHRFVETGYPILLGVSRKRVVAEMVAADDSSKPEPGTVPNDERDRMTAILNAAAYRSGVAAFRVHDVKMNREILDAEWRRTT
jgi:dihydropteroate synthase